MKGFIQGSLWGLVLGVSGLSLVSLVNEQPEFASGPEAPQLATPQPEIEAPSAAAALDTTRDTAPVFAPASTLDDVDTAAEAAPDISTESATLPKTTDVASAIAAPDALAETDVTAEEDAPAAPRVETALVEPTIPVEAPDVDTTSAASPAEAPVVAETPEVSEPEVVVVPEATEEAAAEEPVVADAPAEPVEEPVVVETPATPQEEPVVSETPTVAEEDTPTTEPEAEVAEALPQTNAVVRINRPGAEEEPQEEAVEPPADEVVPDDAPALLRHAVPFDAEAAPAKIAIILIDNGALADAVEAVSGLGFVPTVAVNALSSASTELAAAYSAAGVEVAMQAALPEGAQPADVEVAFEAALGLVPNAAMLFSDGTGAMQNRAVTAQVMEILAADGHGFVGVQRGLSNAARAAEQAGVSAATILRDIDGADEDARAILRGLDQAAFRARQTGEAVLLGRVEPATLQALQEWAADLDQETLVIAPVSAILMRDE